MSQPPLSAHRLYLPLQDGLSTDYRWALSGDGEHGCPQL